MKAGDAIAQKTEDAIDRIRWSKMEAEEKKVEADHLTKYREERALEAKIAEKARSEKEKAALLAKVKKPTADDEEESEEEDFKPVKAKAKKTPPKKPIRKSKMNNAEPASKKNAKKEPVFFK